MVWADDGVGRGPRRPGSPRKRSDAYLWYASDGLRGEAGAWARAAHGKCMGGCYNASLSKTPQEGCTW